MNKKQQALTIILALIAGLVGWVASSQLLRKQPVVVEKTSQIQTVFVAEGFQLVDADKKTRATLRLDAYGRACLAC